MLSNLIVTAARSLSFLIQTKYSIVISVKDCETNLELFLLLMNVDPLLTPSPCDSHLVLHVI